MIGALGCGAEPPHSIRRRQVAAICAAQSVPRRRRLISASVAAVRLLVARYSQPSANGHE
jgi:hypothetical protein